MEKTLDDYKAERSSLEGQIYNRRQYNDRIKGEIDRLQTAYDTLGKIKRDNLNNADKVRDDAKLKKVANDVDWRGLYKNQFDNAMKDRVTQAAEDFFDSIDDIHDEIGTALNNKKGEYDTGIGILDGLNKAWNTVSGIIRNWIN